MIRRAVFTLLTSAMLAGCGTGLPGMNQPQAFEMPEFTLAPGWTAAVAAPQHAPRNSCLVARRDGSLALAYDTQKHGGKDVFVVTSHDGRRWSAPLAVGQTRRTEEAPALWEDAAGKLHLVYASNQMGYFQLYKASSMDGKTWSEPVAITQEDEAAKNPSVTLTPQGVALAFQTMGGACEVMTSSDGETWGPSRRIDDSAGEPAIIHDGEGLRVVFHRHAKLYERIERAGVWSEPVQVPGHAAMQDPALAWMAGTLTLAYSTLSSNGTWKLAVREAGPSGWGQERDLVQGPDDHGFPSLAEGQDGGTWLAWGISRLTEERGIFVARSGGR